MRARETVSDDESDQQLLARVRAVLDAPTAPNEQIAQLAALLAPEIERERATRTQIEAALQARDTFFSIATHELKTPLTSLIGQAQLLQRRIQRGDAAPERMARGIDVVITQADRLNRMVSALLDFSRIEQGRLAIERAPVDLTALVRRVVEQAQPTLDHHPLILDVPPDALIVSGDAVRIEQVFINLISNAAKFSPAGSTVLVRLEREGAEAVLTVVDRGIGVPTEDQPRLFTRFFRAGNAQRINSSGLGIGLYITREVVEMHGGSVSVTSVPDEGSSFQVRLPLSG